MSNNKKALWTPQGVTTKFSVGGLGNLVNPLSSLYKQTQDYVPEWWVKAFTPANGDAASKKAGARTAHVLAKVLAGGATFAGAAWLLRAFMHSLDIDNVQSIKASARASRKLDTIKQRPVDPAIVGEVPQLNDEQKKKKEAAQMNKQESFGYDMAKGALPPAAVLLATLATFKLADKHYDTRLGNRLDSELAAARSQSQDLALQRILRNRGLEQPEPEDTTVADTYSQQMKGKAKERAAKKKKVNKTASINKKAADLLPGGLQSAIGLLVAAVIATGGIVGYNWQHGNSANLAKYKAYKKGLQTYNKQRVLSEPIESTPLDPQFLDYLDTNVAAAKKQAPNAPVESSLKDILV